MEVTEGPVRPTLSNQQIIIATINAQEQERQRVAVSLHNGLCQMLYWVKLSLQSVNPEFRADPQFQAAEKLLIEAITEARSISHQLLPRALEKHGLEGAVKLVLEQVGHGTEMIFKSIGLDQRLPAHVETVVYRIIQELILNVVKHARADRVMVNLIRSDRDLNILVADNGIGIVQSDGVAGYGLETIRTQVELFNGTLHISHENGTEVSICIPDSF